MNIAIDDFLVSDEASVDTTASFLQVFDIDEATGHVLVNQFSDFGCDEHGLMWVTPTVLSKYRKAGASDLSLVKDNTLLKAEIVKKEKLGR